MILVSACLLGENCKYNGGNNENACVKAYLEGKEYTAVCPETFGGLKSPRDPAEIRGGRVFLKDGTDVTDAFRAGADIVLEMAKKTGATVAILKEASPSCGRNFIYDGTFSGTKIKGCGITVQALLKEGITVKSEQDLEKEQNV